MRKLQGDEGSAIVEFIVVAMVVLIPLAYIVISVMRVESAALAVTQAAREAGRAYVTSPTFTSARGRAQSAANVALADQHFNPPSLEISCGSSCRAAGQPVRFTVSTMVPLPFLPEFLTHGGIPVAATHIATVDRFRPW